MPRSGAHVRKFLAPSGDLEALRESCAEVRAYSDNNYLPLLWRRFRAHRFVIPTVSRSDWQ